MLQRQLQNDVCGSASGRVELRSGGKSRGADGIRLGVFDRVCPRFCANQMRIVIQNSKLGTG